MTGDPDDIRQRLRLTLPTRWFADVAPVLDGVLSGFAASWGGLYQLLQFVIRQSRVRTATDQFLDLAAQDRLSAPLPRRVNEGDDAYRARLLAAMQRLRGTRPALIDAAATAGYRVSIFEAAQPIDTGAYNVSTMLAWNTIGAWGSMAMPLESLVVATPGSAAYEGELWQNIAAATPAGGVVWLHVAAGS